MAAVGWRRPVGVALEEIRMSAIQSLRVYRSFPADRQRFACRRRVLAGRDTAPSGEPMRQGRLGGEGTRLATVDGIANIFHVSLFNKL